MLELAARTDSPSVTGAGTGATAECRPAACVRAGPGTGGASALALSCAGPSSGFGVRAVAGAGPRSGLAKGSVVGSSSGACAGASAGTCHVSFLLRC